ncbi:hypothetical protein N5C43_14020 [Comamonas terrigena]|jgi:hypothetical protein|uniref:hypothetical protein n=1 Tax=Comamonas terrigena TaxID=32013 RepID=UPI00244AE016|nr:hypothetical protein [Comamonas terrigena]MDH1292370.1 hypothetical protein [Comamonas terrigena]
MRSPLSLPSFLPSFPISLPPQAAFGLLSKQELRALADRLLVQDVLAVDRCIAFVLADTRGLWHGRARAMVCRRLKHCPLGRSQRTQLLSSMLLRLQTGAFAEQFKDQLRLARHLERQRTLAAAERALTSSRPYVQRYAQWTVAVCQSPAPSIAVSVPRASPT